MTKQTNFLCKYLRKNGTVLPVDMGPGEVFDEKKCQKSRDTVPLNSPTLSLLYQWLCHDAVLWEKKLLQYNHFYNSTLKRQSNDVIFDSQFFSSFKLVWATDQGVKIFSNLVSFSQRYSKVSIKTLTQCNIILRWVKNKFHPRTFLRNGKLLPFFSII